jgi:hypothetical protein
MVKNEIQYIPFTEADELALHFDTSILLIERIKETADLMVKSDGKNRRELEVSVTKSIHVLIEGFTAAVHSIQQGCIK